MTTPRLFALASLAALGFTGTASAAWDNVFQVCCNDCGKPTTSYSVPCCPQPCCPQPEMRISYVQRCYYQPCTEYVRKTYYEPCTKKVTTYYYEPVTEYKYTTYYDPCTGCPQRVCTPQTSYKLRSQCNAVTSYVERCAMVPVTTLKPVTYQQPVVSYYYPPQPAGSSSSLFPPVVPRVGPQVDEFHSNPPSVVPERIPPTDVPTTPGGTANPRPGSNVKLRPEKTVSRSSVVTVRGEVTLADQLTPRGNAKLVFVNADKPDQKEYVNANAYGE